jgi:hypothetical protein
LKVGGTGVVVLSLLGLVNTTLMLGDEQQGHIGSKYFSSKKMRTLEIGAAQISTSQKCVAESGATQITIGEGETRNLFQALPPPILVLAA